MEEFSIDLSDPIAQILLRVFGRTPAPREVETWSQKLENGISARTFVHQLINSKQVKAAKFVKAKNPPGHYFSPVVDPDQVREYVEAGRQLQPEDIAGIDFPFDDMVAFWEKNRGFIAATPFKDDQDGTNRYYYSGGPFNYGDAITLRAMIGNFRPRRIVEIGSGFSSACMLDAAEHAQIDDFHLTCIEPYPDRLKRLLREDDKDRVEIFERGVQGMPMDLFKSLERNDILFIDSTHVMKTGSDVHYEIFHILPVLRPGVVIHFHDCRWPFEYSDKQIFQKNYSWNEVYAVRALLMYSYRFTVIFYNSLFAMKYPELIKATNADYLRNPGSSLWLQVQN